MNIVEIFEEHLKTAGISAEEFKEDLNNRIKTAGVMPWYLSIAPDAAMAAGKGALVSGVGLGAAGVNLKHNIQDENAKEEQALAEIAELQRVIAHNKQRYGL